MELKSLVIIGRSDLIAVKGVKSKSCIFLHGKVYL